jgi:ribosomal protein L13
MTTTKQTSPQQPQQTSQPLIVDATQQIVGRLASKVAKASLMGHTIHVVNCEKAIISGKKEVTFSKYLVEVLLQKDHLFPEDQICLFAELFEVCCLTINCMGN